jgi:hypothetical protein
MASLRKAQSSCIAVTRAIKGMEEKRMRKIVIATLIASGVALAATSAGLAAPATSTGLKQAETTIAPTVKIQYYHHPRCHGYYSRWHWC